MPQVTLRINGFSYVLGCDDGEEVHLLAMADEVDRRINVMKGQTGPGGESRMLLLAALMMADELHETGKPNRPAPAAKPDPKLTRRLDRMAKRAEDIAEGLLMP